MNNKLELVKSSKFGEVECDIYSNEKRNVYDKYTIRRMFRLQQS